MVSKGALHGLRVLDLTQYVAGPYCTRLLAGLGADVVKVEPPEGDPARGIGPFPPGAAHPERSPLFLFLNQGKQGITLDLSTAQGRERCLELVRRADVLVEGFAPRASSDWGLSYEALSRINPALVVTSITSFGREGPYRDYVAPEIVACALGGLLHLSGDPAREPLQPAGWQASYLAGASAAVGTLLALHYRRRTGRGQQVDVSAMESLLSVLEGAVAAAAAGEPPRQRRGNRRSNDLPLLLLPCRDGHVVVAVASEADWEPFSYFVGDERLRGPRFATPAGRRQNAAELEAILAGWLRGVSRSELFAAAQDWRLPCCVVLAPEELPGDAQHRARRFFATIDHPVAGPLRYPGAPFRMAASPWQCGRAPLLGEHNQGVFERWGGMLQGVTPKAGARADSLSVPTGQGDVRPYRWAMPDRVRMKRASAGGGREHLWPSFAGALAGIRVLDLTSMWAGPYCTRLLADAGAEVIKIELATRPDGTRRSALNTAAGAPPDREPAAFFRELNRNKYGVTLDLGTAADRERFCRLVALSDVVVENFSPRVMPNLGLDYAALRAMRPDIVMLSMPAFGGTGPYRHAVAFGSGLEAMSGLSALSGYRAGPPALLGVAYGDPVAGLHGAVAVLAALEHRQRTGKGQHIDLAQREALTQFIGEVLVGIDMGAARPERQGNRHSAMAPHGCYRCRGEDRWVAIAVGDEEQWLRLCAVLGRPELAFDERFGDVARRQEHHEALDRIIEAWTLQRGHREVMQLLQEAGVPAGAVLDPLDLLADAQLAALGFWVGSPGPLEGGCADVGPPPRYPGALCHLSASPLRVRLPAPQLGEHNDRIPCAEEVAEP